MTQRQRIPERIASLPESHRRNSQAINWLLDRMDRLIESYREKGLLVGNTGTYTNGQTIVNYSQGITQPDGKLTADPITGLITIEEPGWYDIIGYVAGTGSTNNQNYGAQVVSSLSGNFALGVQLWSNQAVAMVFAATTPAHLVAGETLQMDIYASGGSFTCANAELGAIAQLLDSDI